MIHLSESDIKYIQAFAKRLAENDGGHSMQAAMKEFGLTVEQYESMVKRMEHIGVVCNITGTDGNYATWFEISPNCLDVARDIEISKEQKQAPADIVTQLQARARRNPVLAGIIIFFVLLAFVANLGNTVLSLWEKVTKAPASQSYLPISSQPARIK